LTPGERPQFYAGNFSLPAACSTLFGKALDFNLKAAIARRMLLFPETLGKDGLLRIAADCLVSDRPLDHIALMVIWPLEKLQNAILDLQDHFEALVYILDRGKPIPNWLRSPGSHRTQTIKTRSGESWETWTAQSFDAIHPARDAEFRARVAAAGEWTDLELLFRTLTELKARPLILSMPIDAYAARGISRSAREIYYDRMRDLAVRYHFPLVEFEEHDADPNFLIAHREHPTPKGWKDYDRVLDRFFHGNK
jgi:DltD protein